MAYTEVYKEHSMYAFNGFCKVVIRYVAINAWWERGRRREKEISFEYLTEEKFYPLSTTDEYFKAPYEEHTVTLNTYTHLGLEDATDGLRHSGKDMRIM